MLYSVPMINQHGDVRDELDSLTVVVDDRRQVSKVLENTGCFFVDSKRQKILESLTDLPACERVDFEFRVDGPGE